MRQNPKDKIKFFAILLFYLMSNLAYGAEFEFRFKKRILSDTYNLHIINHSLKRAVEFDFSNAENYYAQLNNGEKIKIGSKIFEIPSNSLVCIEPGTKGYISFEIPKSIMQNAKEIIFKGMSYTPRYEGSFLYTEDAFGLTVIVDVAKGTIRVTETEVQ